jgi:hypothetical protein
MSKERTCPREEIVAYDFGELTDEERAELERHLRECRKCREYLAFIGKLKQHIKKIPELAIGAHPSLRELSLYCSGGLDDETTANVGAHILYCDDCFHEMLAVEEIQQALAAVAEKPLQKRLPSIPKVTKRIREMAELADAIDSNEGGWQRGSRLLQIGRLAYRQLVSSPYASHWEPLAKFAHGALNQAVILLRECVGSPQYAEACYSLSLVCRYIARWTQQVTIAERALSLLKVASDHPTTKDLASLGLGNLSEVQAEALIEDLRERGQGATEAPGLVSAEAAIPVLDPVEMLGWLRSTYEVEPRGKKGLWSRIAAVLLQGAPMPEAFMRPSLAEIMVTMGARQSVRDEKSGEVLGELRPGMKGRLYWPRDVRPRVCLVLSIEDRRRLGLVPEKPIQIILWANVPPPEGLEWADWVIRGNWKVDIGPHKRSIEIPVTQPCLSVDEEHKNIIRNWICQCLVIEPPSQEMEE